MLPVALANTIAMMLRQLGIAGLNRRRQLSVLCAPLQQQMLESGLIRCLEQFMEATAEQLERSSAASAAAPAGDSRAALAAAAGAAAAGNSATPASTHGADPKGCLKSLQLAGGKLLDAFVSLLNTDAAAEASRGPGALYIPGRLHHSSDRQVYIFPFQRAASPGSGEHGSSLCRME